MDEELVQVDGGRGRRAGRLGCAAVTGDVRGRRPGRARTGAPAAELALNQWSLAGEWAVGEEAAVLEAPGGSIAYRFEGRDLNLVLTPSGGPVRFTVRLDGQPPGADHGVDTDESGEGVLSGPRMYQLVRQRGPIRERTAEIAFHEPGARAYVFTFG